MTKALIIGGGIAGPVTGMALERAGIESVVYEAYRETADVGSYLTVATNGLDALRAIDADRPVVAEGFATPEIVLQSGTGKVLGRVPTGGRLPDGTGTQTIKRPRLHRVLREEASRRGVAIEHGKRLVDVERVRGGGVLACFEDGTQAAGDLLVGADGVHSTVRRAIDPDAPGGRYVGLVNFGGYTAGASFDAEPGIWHMIFGRRAFFGYVVDPSGGVVWFANVPRPEVGNDERAETTSYEWKRQLIELFGPDRGPANELITAGDLELAGDNTYDLASIPTWHAGSMIIVGDAAHAPASTSGQGASMAMEDGILLAKCLRDRPDTPEALAAFDRLRRKRVERIVKHGARGSSNKTPGPVARVARDLMLSLLFKVFVTPKSLAWVYDHHIDWPSSLGPDGDDASWRRDAQ
jgi:2-polyprenyl-6-methoxyphenol hydroxylase-like FAD-dependent oxidoreductase